jgi:site-specific DNA-methyltransferase (adenine-specific)
MITIGNSVLYNANCLDVFAELNQIDMILTDPPYGTTACKWDAVIDLKQMWYGVKSVIKPNGAIVFTASQPFTSILVASNLKMFRTSWIYQKRCASNFAQGKYMPMKEHEDVLVFGENKTVYYPIMQERKGSGLARSKYSYSDASRANSGEFVGKMKGGAIENDSGNNELRLPSSVQEFNNRSCGDRGFHPTQKPVALMEYLIKTYTKENETVLDFTMGSGTTGVACVNLNRKFIGIEKDEDYFKIACKRIADANEKKALSQGTLFEPAPSNQVYEQVDLMYVDKE